MLDVAVNVLDREAPEDFTMRRVADELGVGVMTLYGYVANKDELLEGVARRVLTRTDVDAGAPWSERLRADATHLFDVCRRHPHLVTLVLGRSSGTPGLFPVRERMLDALLEAGHDETTALHVLGALTSYALGFGALGDRGTPADVAERVRALPEHEHPRLTAVADRYAEHVSEQAFVHGLELLLAGVRGELAGASGADRRLAGR